MSADSSQVVSAVERDISPVSCRGLKDNSGQDQKAEDQEGRHDNQQF